MNRDHLIHSLARYWQRRLMRAHLAFAVVNAVNDNGGIA